MSARSAARFAHTPGTRSSRAPARGGRGRSAAFGRSDRHELRSRPFRLIAREHAPLGVGGSRQGENGGARHPHRDLARAGLRRRRDDRCVARPRSQRRRRDLGEGTARREQRARAADPAAAREADRRRASVAGIVTRVSSCSWWRGAPQRRHICHSAGTGYLQVGHSTASLRRCLIPPPTHRRASGRDSVLHACSRFRPRDRSTGRRAPASAARRAPRPRP